MSIQIDLAVNQTGSVSVRIPNEEGELVPLVTFGDVASLYNFIQILAAAAEQHPGIVRPEPVEAPESPVEAAEEERVGHVGLEDSDD